MPSELRSRPSFRDDVGARLAVCPPDVMAAHHIFELEANQAPWVDTGFAVGAGDQVTVLLAGRIYLDEAADLWLDPALQVWTRIGESGPIVRGSRASNTFTAERSGNVQLGNVNPAEWVDADGAIDFDPALYEFMSGGSTVALLRWAPGVDVAASLRTLAAGGDVDGIMEGEADRIDQSAGQAPGDWEHLWFIGPTEVFHQHDPGLIDCATRNNFAILCHATDVALTPDTTLSWGWKIESLPSNVAEDAFATHDYLSIAVAFDDGTDLTYQWSVALPPETVYQCPLPHWSERETHLVVRSGPADLGQWRHEERNVSLDRARAIGGAAPGRITGVWLIAVSFLQHGEGKCSYSGITLTTGDARMDIL